MNVGKRNQAKRQPVTVDSALHVKYKMYSELTNIPIAQLVNRALAEWFENVGEARLEVMLEGATADIKPPVTVGGGLVN